MGLIYYVTFDILLINVIDFHCSLLLLAFGLFTRSFLNKVPREHYRKMKEISIKPFCILLLESSSDHEMGQRIWLVLILW